ncbi:MAG: hypothetical protein J6T74_04340 [Clostridia bacterium]|nr:hypothetical protein [Clostridia bacterium]
MKRRTKIITTIASITLALAIMVFGVYAATTASFTITSSVAFTPTDMFIHCELKLYSGDGETEGDTATQVGSTQSWDSYTGTGSAKTPKASASQSLTISPASSPLSAENPTVRYVVTIRNDGPFTLLVALSNEATSSKGDWGENITCTTSTKKVGASNYSDGTGLVSDATYTYTRYATIADFRKYASVELHVTFTVSKKS